MQEDNYLNLYEIDSHGLPHNIPHLRYKHWSINSIGFVGKELDFEKKEGEVRIVCFGGSETFGVYESPEKNWPSQLETIMTDRFSGVTVINASVIGLDTKQRIDYTKKYILPLKPDVLIIYHHRLLINVNYTLRGVQKNFRRDKTPGRKPQPHFREYFLAKLEKIFKKLFLGALSNHIQVWRLSVRVKEKEKRAFGDQKPLSEVPEAIISEYEEDLKQFVEYLRSKRITPVLATISCLASASNKNIYKRFFLDNRFTYCISLSIDGIIDALDKANHRIRKMAEEHNILLADTDRLVPKTLEYYGDNLHFTDKGAEVVANNMCHMLERSNIVNGGSIESE